MRLLLLTALGTLLVFADQGMAAAAEPAKAPAASTAPAAPAASAEELAIRQASQGLTQAFNRGEAKQAAALFLPDGELVDEVGQVHQGTAEIEAVFARFFAKFPGATIELKSEATHLVSGSVALEDGIRTIATKEGGQAANGYTAVYAKQEGQWKIASLRERGGEDEPTPHERLLSLAWLVGEWVDEESSAAVKISCRWSDDGNFLLVDFGAHVKGKKVLESEQRIGWDPLTESVRSWVFDSDGGFGEGRWTLVEGRWVIKSNAVMPDGTIGSATISMEPTGKDKFVMKGRDRILGDAGQADFETTIVRKPPQPSK